MPSSNENRGFGIGIGGARVIKLEENFRSTQPILNLANAIIADATQGYAKQLFSTTTTSGSFWIAAKFSDSWKSPFDEAPSPK